MSGFEEQVGRRERDSGRKSPPLASELMSAADVNDDQQESTFYLQLDGVEDIDPHSERSSDNIEAEIDRQIEEESRRISEEIDQAIDDQLQKQLDEALERAHEERQREMDRQLDKQLDEQFERYFAEKLSVDDVYSDCSNEDDLEGNFYSLGTGMGLVTKSSGSLGRDDSINELIQRIINQHKSGTTQGTIQL
eukprot:CAMPEP_0197449956 /NCGR_PEP_ID=MMETSP1175-20131217/23488_1 /TAXON_ID=1003142 /ORGANISM="Triceratium dubium, Strain CCMP147" /LENGTH=192 /DNA_ID=CAMNT_0042982249 /DNA_START=170 /DNA_END=748 /DNA_ORIENTATION=-